ncbi:MAG TPA: DUF1800 domain-containing protein [Burkholderiaceae bacterium]|nr:DUF1800 domain-containing protein [Burkholderiaceae bacterium]
MSFPAPTSFVGYRGGVKQALNTLQRRLTAALLCVNGAALLASCASGSGRPLDPSPGSGIPAQAQEGRNALDPVGVLDRLSWGATSSAYEQIRSVGTAHWIAEQLKPDEQAALPAAVQEQIAAMSIESASLSQLVFVLEAQRKSVEAISDVDAKKAAQHDYQLELNRLAREAANRELLRDLYSPKQLQEQMTWFWVNHFNVHQHKHMIRAMLGDYERGLRAHALGSFRDLLATSARHPAMLAYLDNAQNAAGHLNENYARELLELHTLGVDGGYTQRDVQELARVLTGFGINNNDPAYSETPRMPRALVGQYLRDGLFEFNPKRHDYGDKIVLGQTIRGRGAVELDEVLDLLSHHPATARNISRKLARFLIADEPPPRLVAAMQQEFIRSNGEIAATLRVAIDSPEFASSLHGKFKDPIHYVVSAVRLAYDRKPIVNANPMIHWLNRLGEVPFNHATPDGYSLTESAWDGPGQMAVRFEIAKAIGFGSAGLFRTEGPNPAEKPAFPQLANAVYYESTQRSLAPTTRQVLDQAVSPQEWNLLLLSSPEFMLR